MYLLSKAGKYHIDRNEQNEDAGIVLNGVRFDSIILCDGVSTRKKGGEGARIACCLAKDVIEHMMVDCNTVSQGWENSMLRYLQTAIKEIAERRGDYYSDYSSTILVLIIDKEESQYFYMLIGDSVLTHISKGVCNVITEPQVKDHECCAITTDGAERMMKSGKGKYGTEDDFIVCSDGAWESLYCNGRIRSKASYCIAQRDYKGLLEIVDNSDNEDDYSIFVWKGEKAA
ncbi:MAG: protein phosphatase 2C domain-containing protein [Lachnospiraceae bacterium]|nr:protein phosphatase 2C domain-containing protein [Lachnospiraceae bacterium]